MNIRVKRLYADYQLLTSLFDARGPVILGEYSGNPPERYTIEYHVKGLAQKDEKILPKDMHLVEVVLPRNYPREAPFCRMLSPVFHPNISPQNICIGDHWAAGESLSHLLVRIAEMICFQSYNLKSPLNGEAAKWTELNLASLPLERRDFFSPYADRENEVLAQRLKAPESLSTPEARGPEPPQPPAPGRAPAPVRRASLCADCGNPCAAGHVYCNSCYTSRSRYGAPAGPPNEISRPGPVVQQSPAVSRTPVTACQNCMAPLSDTLPIRCVNGHNVCGDCALKCLSCGSYFCALCNSREYTFRGRGIVCAKCQSR